VFEGVMNKQRKKYLFLFWKDMCSSKDIFQGVIDDISSLQKKIRIIILLVREKSKTVKFFEIICVFFCEICNIC
jgi:hypothetical protein